MYVYRVYVFACAMFAGLATDTSMDGTEDVFEFMHELCHLLQNSKKSGWEVGILGICWGKIGVLLPHRTVAMYNFSLCHVMHKIVQDWLTTQLKMNHLLLESTW